MKRKPNKPQQEPREPADPGGASSGGAGGGSPGGAGPEGTSGQSVHKSKFRQKSKQEQAAASKLRMEKRGEKLEAVSYTHLRCNLCGADPGNCHGRRSHRGNLGHRGLYGFALFHVIQTRDDSAQYL